MNYYLAPLEEITSFIFRNAVTEMFGAPDRCFAPFIAPTQKRLVKTRERRDVDPENNRGIALIPQILTRHPKGFTDVAEWLFDRGYREINFNLGCPSGTVTAKGRGSGFLKTPDDLDAFFDEVFQWAEAAHGGELLISVKTRIGFEDVGEFPQIFSILKKYPFSEIIIHPRLRTDLYRGPCHMEAIDYAVEHRGESRLVYNGDICSPEDVERFGERYPDIDSIMIGRGMVKNPALIRCLRGGADLTTEELFAFTDRLFQGYSEQYSGEMDAVYKLKEVWSYLAVHFPEQERGIRDIKKAKNPKAYHKAIEKLRERS